MEMRFIRSGNVRHERPTPEAAISRRNPDGQIVD
jgi:hypothetical protein